jgi:hypothetical protein
MKLLTLRTCSALSALCLTTLLAACGGPQDELPTQTAASIQTGSATTSVRVSADASTGAATTGATGSAAAGSTGVPTASATMPQPDCAADGCNGPRIIDANAEAWRYAAMQRAAADVSQS